MGPAIKKFKLAKQTTILDYYSTTSSSSSSSTKTIVSSTSQTSQTSKTSSKITQMAEIFRKTIKKKGPGPSNSFDGAIEVIGVDEDPIEENVGENLNDGTTNTDNEQSLVQLQQSKQDADALTSNNEKNNSIKVTGKKMSFGTMWSLLLKNYIDNCRDPHYAYGVFFEDINALYSNQHQPMYQFINNTGNDANTRKASNSIINVSSRFVHRVVMTNESLTNIESFHEIVEQAKSNVFHAIFTIKRSSDFDEDTNWQKESLFYTDKYFLSTIQDVTVNECLNDDGDSDKDDHSMDDSEIDDGEDGEDGDHIKADGIEHAKEGFDNFKASAKSFGAQTSSKQWLQQVYQRFFSQFYQSVRNIRKDFLFTDNSIQ